MNSRLVKPWLMMALLSSSVLGCGGDGGRPGNRFESLPPATLDPDDPEQVESIASLSAPHAHAMGYMAVLIGAIGSGEICTSPTDGGEPVCMPTGNGCPSSRETADGMVIEGGGCTTEEGQTWTGRAVLRGFARDADGELAAGTGGAEVVYEGLAIEGPSDCPTAAGTVRAVFDGSMVMTPSGETGFDFDLDLEITGSGLTEECVDLATITGIYEYHGSRREEGTREIWNGSGRFGTTEGGVFEAMTEDEVLDSSACSNEALSGTTTVTAGEDVAVFTYDGATDCDEASTVTWTFNGADRGEIEGVRCAVAPGSRRGPGGALIVLGTLLLLGMARRSFRGTAARES